MAALTGWTRDEIEWRTPYAVCLQMMQADAAWEGGSMIWPEQAAERKAALAAAVARRKSDTRRSV